MHYINKSFVEACKNAMISVREFTDACKLLEDMKIKPNCEPIIKPECNGKKK